MKNKIILIGVSLSLPIAFLTFKHASKTEIGATQELSQNKKRTLKEQRYLFDELSIADMLNLSVAFITGADGSSASFVQRDQMILRLKPENIDDADYAALMAFMSEEPPGEGRQLAFMSLKNNVMSFLIESDRYPVHLAAKMTQDMTNPNTNQIWREYVAQYVPDLIAKLDVKSAAYSDVTDQLIDALWEASLETKGALAGTALIGLHKLKKTHPQINKSQLAELTANIALDENYESAARMGAIRLVDESQIEAIKQIAFAEASSITLRMAALNQAHSLSKHDSFFEEELRQTFLESSSDKRLTMLVKNLLKEQ